MINTILMELNAGKIYITEKLAKKLNITPELLEAILLYLQDSGEIKSTKYLDNEDHCQGCNKKCQYKPVDSSRIKRWEIINTP